MQYHALREQVQSIARSKKIQDVESKQVGLDPMPDFPIHDLEGSLTPTMPVIMPTQLKPAVRKFSPDELGIKEDRPPVQLSSQAIQLLQRNNMHDLFRGVKFFGAGIDQPECILRSSWAAKPKVLSLVTAGVTRIGWPKESVQAYPAHQQWHRPYFISIRSCTKSDVPSTSFISWTGKTKQVSSPLAMPQHNGQFIAYSFQSPRAFTWTLRRGTAATKQQYHGNLHPPCQHTMA
jgi:hypothetical protein